MPSNSQPGNGTSNRDAYRESFLRHVHCLLQLGYESLVPTEFTNAEEDDITGEICKRMKELTEEQPTKKWMAHFSVHDQDPVNKKKNPQTGKPRRGKHRPRLDIRLVNKSRIPNSGFCIEAKRLYCSNSVSDYMDDEGLGAFVSGYYAESDSAAGMLGYVQGDSIADWLQKLQKKSGEVWPLRRFNGGPANTYHSVHDRKKIKSQIEILHTLLLFC